MVNYTGREDNNLSKSLGQFWPQECKEFCVKKLRKLQEVVKELLKSRATVQIGPSLKICKGPEKIWRSQVSGVPDFCDRCP